MTYGHIGGIVARKRATSLAVALPPPAHSLRFIDESNLFLGRDGYFRLVVYRLGHHGSGQRICGSIA